MKFKPKNEPPDGLLPRPESVEAKEKLIRQIYGWNGWGKREHRSQVEMLSLPLKAIANYSEKELDVFLADFEKYKMVGFL